MVRRHGFFNLFAGGKPTPITIINKCSGRYTPIKAGSRRQAKQIADSVNSATVYETRISDCQLKNRLYCVAYKKYGEWTDCDNYIQLVPSRALPA